MAEEDKRIERLYDYTKWHIGVYLTLGGGLIAGVGYFVRDTTPWDHVRHETFLFFSFCAMVLAGIAGAVVASSLIHIVKWEEFWEGKQGFWGMTIMKGRYWTHLEHFCFWLSLGLATIGVLTGEIADILKLVPKTKYETNVSQSVTPDVHEVICRSN